MHFEKRYEDVLQNLESGIMITYREEPEMTDYDVMAALEALRRHYIREARQQEAATFSLPERAQKIFAAVHSMCELRLGRGDLFDEDGNPLELGARTVSVNEIIDCLKRLEHSVQRWNKSGGRKGYLNFVEEFFPAGLEGAVLLRTKT